MASTLGIVIVVIIFLIIIFFTLLLLRSSANLQNDLSQVGSFFGNLSGS